MKLKANFRVNCGRCGNSDVLYIINKSQLEELEYPHDERCEDSMCWCVRRAKKENPEKYKKYLERRKS